MALDLLHVRRLRQWRTELLSVLVDGFDRLVLSNFLLPKLLHVSADEAILIRFGLELDLLVIFVDFVIYLVDLLGDGELLLFGGFVGFVRHG